MNALKRMAKLLGLLWAPALLLLIVLACGVIAQVNSPQAEPHPALSVALRFGSVI